MNDLLKTGLLGFDVHVETLEATLCPVATLIREEGREARVQPQPQVVKIPQQQEQEAQGDVQDAIIPDVDIHEGEASKSDSESTDSEPDHYERLAKIPGTSGGRKKTMAKRKSTRGPPPESFSKRKRQDDDTTQDPDYVVTPKS
ncbi:hypothetical protein L1987_33179 [Smallanthus sonchifolius]|uniref:Uncharacterized protein n=1 Tax=Smallanthus sonchifolius TaxID=185202 RepID=A0ACB9HS13_9ASTR|nr:hypothetical protein L1987_33179 [Smallanthus sonchifolius]